MTYEEIDQRLTAARSVAAERLALVQAARQQYRDAQGQLALAKRVVHRFDVRRRRLIARLTKKSGGVQ